MPRRLDPDSLSLDPSRHAPARTGATTPAPRTAAPGTPARRPADFSRVQGSARTVPAGTTAGGTHTVKPGESLSAIAKAHYGDAALWPRIFEANRDRIDDPDLIHPGQVLDLPRA